MNDEIFKVNEFITLKLEDDKTNIYVAGKLFKHCMLLVVNIPTNDVSKFDSMRSIDDLDYISLREIEKNYNSCEIIPEEEFRAHCSNIAAWVENDYNTEILHRTIAFPLLKELVKAGDEKAKRKFKEEIAFGFREGNDAVREYLHMESYLDNLTREEYLSLFPFRSELVEIERELNDQFDLPYTNNEKLYFLPTGLAGLNRYISDKCSKDAFVIGITNYRLSKSKWRRILNVLSSIKQLEMLDLSHNNLKRVLKSYDLEDLKNLKGLDLAYNKLKRVPKSIRDLKNLEWLDLSFNKIENPIEINALEILNDRPRKKSLKYFIRTRFELYKYRIRELVRKIRAD